MSWSSHSRILGITTAALVAIALSAAVWWFLWVPNVRPSLRAGEVFGIDVSNHQGPIDWDAVTEDDVRFAYIKATEGGDCRRVAAVIRSISPDGGMHSCQPLWRVPVVGRQDLPGRPAVVF